MENTIELIFPICTKTVLKAECPSCYPFLAPLYDCGYQSPVTFIAETVGNTENAVQEV